MTIAPVVYGRWIHIKVKFDASFNFENAVTNLNGCILCIPKQSWGIVYSAIIIQPKTFGKFTKGAYLPAKAFQ